MQHIIRLTLLAVFAWCAASLAEARPNIVILVGDDMGYADIGVHGSKEIPTPNIDAIAGEGVRCTNGYVSGPYCSPTRAGLLTGRYQTRFGHEFNPGGAEKNAADGADSDRNKLGLSLTETTIANRLKAAGYRTALVGKWHLGGAPAFHPQRRGFDEFYGFLGGAHSYFPGEGAPIYRGDTPVKETEYFTDAIGRECVAFIDRQTSDQPFFLCVTFNAVHTPMHATNERLKEFASIQEKKRRTYAAMMSAMDDAVGAITGKLAEKGFTDDTLVFFISDNGGPNMPTTTVNASINKPLRGSKRTTLEGGIRVPFLVKWPGHIPSGEIYDKPVIQLDILPTVLAAAGISMGEDSKLDGVDLLPYFEGKNKSAPHETLCWRFGEQMAIRHGDWKLVKYDPTADGILGPRGRATEAKLYNLASDIGEKNDLISENLEVAKRLKAKWDEWNALNVSPTWGMDGKLRN